MVYVSSPIPEPDFLVLLIIDVVLSTLGILGCLLLVACYQLVESCRKYTFRLIIYFTMAEAISALVNIISDIILLSQSSLYDVCKIEGFIKQVGNYIALQLACIISWVFYKRTDQGDLEIHIERKILPIIVFISTMISTM